MEKMFIKKCPKFEGTNYNSWKDKMKTYLLCMGPGYWLVIKVSKDIVEEDNLKSCTKE